MTTNTKEEVKNEEIYTPYDDFVHTFDLSKELKNKFIDFMNEVEYSFNEMKDFRNKMNECADEFRELMPIELINHIDAYITDITDFSSGFDVFVDDSPEESAYKIKNMIYDFNQSDVSKRLNSDLYKKDETKVKLVGGA